MSRSIPRLPRNGAVLLAVACAIGCSPLKTPPRVVVPPSVVGAIRDFGGGYVPGVQVTNTCGAEKRETITNWEGRYRFDDVPLGTCRVEAYLRGFRRSVAEAVVVTATQVAVQDFVLRSGIVIATGEVAPPGGLAGAVRTADAVLYVRVDEVVGPILLGPHQELLMTEHRAVVLAVVKGPSASTAPGAVVRLWQFGAGAIVDQGQPYVGERAPYFAGQEFVSFFKRDSAGRFIEMVDGTFVFHVVNGRVAWPASQ